MAERDVRKAAVTFVGTIVQDVDSKWFQYAGDPSQAHKCVAPSVCGKWFNSFVGKPKRIDVKLNIFGKEVVKTVLFWDGTCFEKPQDFLTYQPVEDLWPVLKTYLSSNILSDTAWQVIKPILKLFEPRTDGHRVILVKREDAAMPEFLREAKPFDVKGVTFDPQDTTSEDRDKEKLTYRNFLILLKEVSQGYRSFRRFSIVNENPDGSLANQKFSVGTDVEVIVRGNKVEKFSQVPTKFVLDRDKSGKWQVFSPDGSHCDTEDFESVQVTGLPGGSRKVVLLGAYTHTLRSVLGYDPQEWQARALINERRINTVAGVRRAGKTIDFAFKIERLLFKDPETKKHHQRPVKGTYVAPTEEKFKTVIDYVIASAHKLAALRIIRWKKSDKRFVLMDESIGRNGMRLESPVSAIDFASDKGYEPMRGSGADEVLMDEAGFISNDTWLNIVPIIENEGAKFYGVSTIDWETPRHWFYEKLISFEQGEDPEGYSIRVTIDDIDERVMSKQSKERAKKALAHNPQRYYAELFATFPDFGSVFEPSKLFILKPEYEEPSLRCVIAYDPAKRSDYGAVMTGVMREGRLEIIDVIKLQGDFTYQRDIVAQIKREAQGKYGKCELIIDATAAGDVVAELFGSLVDFKVWYTNSNNRLIKPAPDQYGAWHVAKRDLVAMSQALIDLKKLRAYSDLSDLSDEIKRFRAFKTSAGNMKYEAVGGHDDCVNAMMLAGFWYGHLHGQLRNSAYFGVGRGSTGLLPTTNIGYELFPSKHQEEQSAYSF